MNYNIADDICQPQNQDYDPVPVSLMDRFTSEELDTYPTLLKILKQFEQKRANRPSPMIQFDQLTELNSSYNSKKLVLVLGAGISIGCGLPSWDTLLNKMRKDIPFSDADPEGQALLFDKMFFKLFKKSNLILARNLHNYFRSENGDTMLYERFVRCVLYRDAEIKCSKTLGEIIRLCSIERGEKLLDSIITYNYDDILEYYLNKETLQNYNSVYYLSGTDIDWKDPSTVPIYHVHGYLPRDMGGPTIKNKIILSEDEYHILYNDNKLWRNTVQLDKFNTKTCLFIGVSLNDPNLRRLLDSARKNGKTNKFHYIIKLRPKLSIYSKKLKLYLKKNKIDLDEKIKYKLGLEETAKDLKRLEERFFEDDALSLGVQTIWADKESDISKILQKIS